MESRTAYLLGRVPSGWERLTSDLESTVACSSFQSSTATSMKFLVSFAYAPPSFLCFNRPTPGGSDAPPIAET